MTLHPPTFWMACHEAFWGPQLTNTRYMQEANPCLLLFPILWCYYPGTKEPRRPSFSALSPDFPSMLRPPVAHTPREQSLPITGSFSASFLVSSFPVPWITSLTSCITCLMFSCPCISYTRGSVPISSSSLLSKS